MKVYDGIWEYMQVYGSMCRYMEVYEGIWRYISIHKPSFSTLFFFNFLGVHFFDIVFFQLVGGPHFRHCFVSTFWRSHFSTLLFFSFFEGLQALGGISSFFSSNFTSNAFRIMSGDLLGPKI